ncbi:MAG: hypothetical protein BWY75_02835 [bacterium ADurb.Bin425]|nr:MAG: hypothetical protein BWY75_02835 [bacterium ADurb.Bin425]
MIATRAVERVEIAGHIASDALKFVDIIKVCRLRHRRQSVCQNRSAVKATKAGALRQQERYRGKRCDYGTYGDGITFALFHGKFMSSQNKSKED